MSTKQEWTFTLSHGGFTAFINSPTHEGLARTRPEYARLISTAPLGLALAQAVVAWWDSKADTGSTEAFVAQARALIAQTEGKES